jgi:hypothetical protein
MKPGDVIEVDGVIVTMWARAPRHIAEHLYDHWWVTRDGPNGREMWAIGRERRHGRFSRNWRLIGRYTWQGQPMYDAH